MADYLNSCTLHDPFVMEHFAHITASTPEFFYSYTGPEYRGRSIENDYVLILDLDEDCYWTVSVYTLDLSPVAHFRRMTVAGAVLDAADFLGIRRATYGHGLEYRYNGAWYACDDEEGAMSA